MNECPEQPAMSNCGLAAAQHLIDNELLVIDTLGMHTRGTSKLLIDQKGAVAQELFRVISVYNEGLVDIADVGCVACGKCVRIVDEYGDLSAGIVQS